MKQIFVNKSIAYGAKVGGGTINKNEINLLDTGAIAVFTEEGVLVTAANAATVLDDVKRFYIALGNQSADSKSLISSLIPRIGTNMTKKAYIAPVKLVKFIGNDGTIGALNNPTLVYKQEAYIRITNTTPGLRTMGAVYNQEIARYSTTVLAGDTINTVITRLITIINADPNRIVNAVVVGAQVGIQLTAIDFGTTFAISLSGILESATIEQPEGTVGNSVAVNFGEGTSDQVSALEDTYSVERGNTQRVYLANKYFTANSLVTPGATYDLYTLNFNGKREIGLGEQNTYHYDIIVAMPAGATQQANFDTIIAELFLGTTSTSAVEIG